jgi:hypothetical protein
MLLPGNRLDRSRSKPAFGASAAGASVPSVVLSADYYH